MFYFGVRGQEGGKHMNRVQFLELFDFIEARFKGTISITIALVSCCIGSLLDPFPVGLDKNVDGMRRSVTQQIYLKNLPSIKSGSVGQHIRTIPKNSISIKVRCLGPPELVISHMLAYKWFTKGLL